jgi:hypothetical protein
MAQTTGTRNVFYSAGKLQYYYYIGSWMIGTNRTFSVTGISALPNHGMEEKPEVLI